MRIVHILPKGVIGGAEKLALDLCKQQILKGDTVSMWFLFGGGPIEKEAIDSGIKTNVFNFKSSFEIIGFYKFARSLSMFNPHIIHLHIATVAMFYLKLIKKKRSVVLHQHDLGLSGMGWIKRSLLKLHKNVPDQYIGVSKFTCNSIKNDYLIDSKRINLIYNGIDLSIFKTIRTRDRVRQDLNLPCDAFVVGGVGRMVCQKGFDLFLKSARIIKDALPNAHFVLVGDGPIRGELEALAKQLNLAECTTFLGMRKDVADLISAFDLFLLSSRSESFGIVLLEAMAMGVPIVAFGVGGIPEVLVPQCGEIVSKENINAMAMSAIDLLVDVNRRDIMGKNEREYVKRFDISKIAKDIDEVYSFALQSQ